MLNGTIYILLSRKALLIIILNHFGNVLNVKNKKHDSIGVSPLKQKGNLISDSKGKADILVVQF